MVLEELKHIKAGDVIRDEPTKMIQPSYTAIYFRLRFRLSNHSAVSILIHCIHCFLHSLIYRIPSSYDRSHRIAGNPFVCKIISMSYGNLYLNT